MADFAAGGASYPLIELVDLTPAERVRIRVEGLGDGPATDGERAQLLARSRHDVGTASGMTMPVLIAAGRYDGIAMR